MATSHGAQIHQLLEAVEDGFNMRLFAVASLAFLVWDHIITFSQEVEYMWTRPVTKGKVVFFFVRYTVPAFSIFCLLTSFQRTFSPQVCLFYSRFSAIYSVLAIAVIEYVLLQRVVALFGNQLAKRLLTLAYVVCFLGSIAATCFVVYKLDILPDSILSLVPLIRNILFGCVTINSPDKPWITLIPALGFETILFMCTVYRATRLTREATLVQRLVQDGTVYFFVAFSSMLFTCLSCFHPRLIFPTLGSNFLINVLAISCTRLQLRLLQAAKGRTWDTELLGDTSLRSPGLRRGFGSGIVINFEIAENLSAIELGDFPAARSKGVDGDAQSSKGKSYPASLLSVPR